jgi:hypothetical protein
MEILEVLLNLGCCLLESTNVAAAIVDAVAWSKSRPNRAAIRTAKKAGEEPPDPNAWTTAFQILTPMVVTLTILMIIKWVRRAG